MRSIWPQFFADCPAGVPFAIDDVHICAVVTAIDGPGGVLGRAGATWIRSDSRLPVTGIMLFDIADIDTLVALDLFEPVIVSLVHIGVCRSLSSIPLT